MSGPTTPEGKIKEGIAYYLSMLRRRGALDFWYNISNGIYDPIKKRYRRNNSPYMRNGISDIVGFLRGGRALFIEVKSKTGTLTDNQKAFQEICTRFGAIYIVARSISDVQEALRAHLKDIDSL